jgi:hypothetical protein
MPNKSDEDAPMLFFFPEIIGVAACLLFSPLWSARLFIQGHYFFGILVLLVAAVGSFAFWRCMVRKLRFVAFFIMLGIAASLMALNSLLPPAEGFMNRPLF